MLLDFNFDRLKKRTIAAAKARDGADKHAYFVAVAHVRFVLRKVFRMIEEKAKDLGLDPLAHQAILQIYGSPQQKLRVSDLAERLDIVPAFASNLIKGLVKQKLVKRISDPRDLRVTLLHITPAGRALCHRIDAEIRPLVNDFTHSLSDDEREIAVSTLMFYIGPGTAKAPTPSKPKKAS